MTHLFGSKKKGKVPVSLNDIALDARVSVATVSGFYLEAQRFLKKRGKE